MDPNLPNPGQVPPAPQQPYPAPNPAAPQPGLPNNGFPPNHNPYEFITNPSAPPRKSPLGGSGSLRQRLLVIIGGAFIVIILIIAVSSLLRGGGTGNAEALQNLLAEQQEIVRVATIGTTKARGADAINLAVTAQQSTSSEQTKLKAYLADKKIKASPEQLSAKKNTATDTALQAAEQNNRFDEAFMTALLNLLTTYKSDLAKSYDTASNETSKAILKDSHASTTVLIDYYSKKLTSQ